MSDPTEVAELERLGYGAVLMVPVRVARGESALVEVYPVTRRRSPAREVDRARVVAQQFGPAPARLATTRRCRPACASSGISGSQPVAAWSRVGDPRISITSCGAHERGVDHVLDLDAGDRAERRDELARRRRAARADVVVAGLAALGEQPVGAHDVAHVGVVAPRVGVAGDDADRVSPASRPAATWRANDAIA